MIYHPVFGKEMEKHMVSKVYELCDDNNWKIEGKEAFVPYDEVKMIPRIMKFDKKVGQWVMLEALRVPNDF